MGIYNSNYKLESVMFKVDCVDYWLGVGARSMDMVKSILSRYF